MPTGMPPGMLPCTRADCRHDSRARQGGLCVAFCCRAWQVVTNTLTLLDRLRVRRAAVRGVTRVQPTQSHRVCNLPVLSVPFAAVDLAVAYSTRSNLPDPLPLFYHPIRLQDLVQLTSRYSTWYLIGRAKSRKSIQAEPQVEGNSLHQGFSSPLSSPSTIHYSAISTTGHSISFTSINSLSVRCLSVRS